MSKEFWVVDASLTQSTQDNLHGIHLARFVVLRFSLSKFFQKIVEFLQRVIFFLSILLVRHEQVSLMEVEL